MCLHWGPCACSLRIKGSIFQSFLFRKETRHSQMAQQVCPQQGKPHEAEVSPCGASLVVHTEGRVLEREHGPKRGL